MHEMNGTWYPWGAKVGDNSPGLYKQAWKRMHRIFADHGATNVKWVWSPLNSDVAGSPMEDWFPGDEYVDVMAPDGYNWGSKHEDFGGWMTFEEVFADSYKRLSKLGSDPDLVRRGRLRPATAATRPSGSATCGGPPPPGTAWTPSSGSTRTRRRTGPPSPSPPPSPGRSRDHRLDAQQPRRAAGQPPVPAAEQRDDRRGEHAADERRVEQDAAAERGGEHLRLGARAGAHGDERQAEDQRGAGDQAAGAADALDDGGVGRARRGRRPRASG